MNTKNYSNLVATGSIAILLLLMAWGNAIGMAIVSAIASVVVAFLLLRRHPRRGVMVTFMLTSIAMAAIIGFLLSRAP